MLTQIGKLATRGSAQKSPEGNTLGFCTSYLLAPKLFKLPRFLCGHYTVYTSLSDIWNLVIHIWANNFLVPDLNWIRTYSATLWIRICIL